MYVEMQLLSSLSFSPSLSLLLCPKCGQVKRVSEFGKRMRAALELVCVAKNSCINSRVCVCETVCLFGHLVISTTTFTGLTFMFCVCNLHLALTASLISSAANQWNQRVAAGVIGCCCCCY